MLLTRPSFPTHCAALNDQFIANADGHAVQAVLMVDLTEADFGAAQIAEDGNGLAPACRGLADVAEHQEVLIQIPMRKIEPANTDAGLEQRKKRFDVATGGTQCRDDFGTDHVTAL